MDSQNSVTPSEGFVNLLSSQYNTDTYSPCIDLGSSEMPSFSTQGTEEPTENALKRKIWSPKEDLVLISAWLSTSKDPIVRNEQRLGSFWKRIQLYYNASQDLEGLPRREWTQCKQRWGRLNDQVCKFVGSYAAALKEKSSGQNDNDVMKLAHEIFFNDYGIKFGLEHAWRELRHDQKWCTSGKAPDGASSKRSKVEDSAQSSTSMPASDNDHGVEARPPGVKASKASAKNSASVKADNKDMKEFSSMWEMKQRDRELKDKIRDKRILESLLAKTEPINEIEMTLKTKLIRAMYDL
ncbi:glutathione S-transferase T3-like [Eutrema salsugineum]|uniref:glutathione S-transferase T3-like n=1 Tax=Eutrema salsugineum TaxID=72664 RepID=UPI000CED2E21|nr:glutathione S-transferase T3-like [Eutrema salsugineum]